ncbi:MAG TPA: polysaccharide biosynthesis C-terminal domain-containing protein, partial [Aggregatilineales bacterium]|nr:polysaccharide biosynthesis C-terminal domain-containing protein [Aggregatilineales bacterium]
GYLPIIHQLYGKNEQNFVLWVNIVGAVINGVLNLIFIPSMGITGALFASAICQWGMLGAYILRN